MGACIKVWRVSLVYCKGRISKDGSGEWAAMTHAKCWSTHVCLDVWRLASETLGSKIMRWHFCNGTCKSWGNATVNWEVSPKRGGSLRSFVQSCRHYMIYTPTILWRCDHEHLAVKGVYDITFQNASGVEWSRQIRLRMQLTFECEFIWKIGLSSSYQLVLFWLWIAALEVCSNVTNFDRRRITSNFVNALERGYWGSLIATKTCTDYAGQDTFFIITRHGRPSLNSVRELLTTATAYSNKWPDLSDNSQQYLAELLHCRWVLQHTANHCMLSPRLKPWL